MKALFLMSLILGVSVQAREIRLNAVHVKNAPSWMDEGLLQEVVSHVENQLEWSTRRVHVTFYKSFAAFKSQHSSGRIGPMTLAYTKTRDQSIHIGPRTTEAKFEKTFGHELAHVILFQKYKDSIPRWLVEGLCNYVAGDKVVDYAWLLKNNPGIDLQSLKHPFNVKSSVQANFHYKVSFALVNMLEDKCPSVRELLNLSLKKKVNVNHFLKSYCGIENLNKDFWKWVQAKASQKKKAR